ncbi:hypothetical protein GI374_13560 [Paracoccus sp. S-4012]|uniref:hypothetical protein n=1 Tax=Paracoccus sp. S-4012 TaxID=2665648 RepID=UPI0012B03C08|nr:hypothetical protein [Paracoccus sp. S-4012]MRX51448.1 hypothetical protein [Paracoccus sp. S-4012]
MTLAAHPRRFLLHHTAERSAGLCAEDDPRPPTEERIIARLTFEQRVSLAEDIHETLTDCAKRDGTHEEDDDQ